MYVIRVISHLPDNRKNPRLVVVVAVRADTTIDFPLRGIGLVRGG